MSPVEQVIAELTARRLAAQDTVDECDQALIALRKLMEPPTAKRRYTRRHVATHKKPRGGSQPSASADARRQRIVDLVTKLKRLRGGEIRTACPDLSNDHVRNALHQLRQKGVLARDGVFWFKC